MNVKLSVLILTLLLTGCAELTAALEEADRQDRQRLEASRAEIDQMLGQKCVRYGFTPGTDAYANCKQRELHSAIQQVQNQQALQSLTTCRNEYGRAIPCSQVQRIPKTTTTDCQYMGNGNYSCQSR